MFKSLELRLRGFHDMIDLLLYLTAKNNNLLFSIFDKTSISFPRSINEDTNMIITEL
jgi:hypothetical protein